MAEADAAFRRGVHELIQIHHSDRFGQVRREFATAKELLRQALALVPPGSKLHMKIQEYLEQFKTMDAQIREEEYPGFQQAQEAKTSDQPAPTPQRSASAGVVMVDVDPPAFRQELLGSDTPTRFQGNTILQALTAISGEPNGGRLRRLFEQDVIEIELNQELRFNFRARLLPDEDNHLMIRVVKPLPSDTPRRPLDSPAVAGSG